MKKIKKVCIKRVMPTLIAGDDIVGVSPMKAPNQSIFELRPKYKETDSDV